MTIIRRRGIFTTSWDDGSQYDLRLAELLAKYKIPATFYFSAKSPYKRLNESEIRRLAGNFDLGSHTFSHTPLTSVTAEEARKEILTGKEWIENTVGRAVNTFCYPKGLWNDEVKQIVGESGFRYARTVSLMCLGVGDRLAAKTTIKVGGLSLPGIIRHGALFQPLTYMAVVSGNLKALNWDYIARVAIDEVNRSGGVFHLWGHSWEIEANHDWQKLESVFRYISENTSEPDRTDNTGLYKAIDAEKLQYYGELYPVSSIAEASSLKSRTEMAYIGSLVKTEDASGSEILEIGSGTGRLATLFEKAHYTGVESVAKLTRFAKKRFGDERHNFYDAKEFGISRRKYDLILLWGTLEDEVNPARVIGEFSRHLIPGGRIICPLNNSHSHLLKLTEWFREAFRQRRFFYTSFSTRFLKNRISGVDVNSVAPVPPYHKFVPFVSFPLLEGSQIVVNYKKQ